MTRPAAHDEVEHPHEHHHYQDEHYAEGGGHTEPAGADLVEDLHRHQVPVGRHQEDGRADGGHGPHESVDEGGEEGRRDERQGDLAEGGDAIRPQVLRRLLYGGVDLVEDGDAVLYAHGHVAEHEGGHEDGQRAGEDDRWAVEGQDVTDAHHGAGHGEVEDAGELHEPAPGEAAPHHQEGDHHAQQPAEGRDEGRNHQRVLDGLEAHIEDVAEVLQRERVIEAPHAREGADEDDEVEGRHQQAEEPGDAHEQDLDRPANELGGGGRGLTGDRDVLPARDPVALDGERREAGYQQHGCQGGTARQVEGARDLQVGLRRQHGEGGARQHQRVAEVGQRLDEHDEQRAGDAGQ